MKHLGAKQLQQKIAMQKYIQEESIRLKQQISTMQKQLQEKDSIILSQQNQLSQKDNNLIQKTQQLNEAHTKLYSSLNIKKTLEFKELQIKELQDKVNNNKQHITNLESIIAQKDNMLGSLTKTICDLRAEKLSIVKNIEDGKKVTLTLDDSLSYIQKNEVELGGNDSSFYPMEEDSI